jgi:hypothetical protein
MPAPVFSRRSFTNAAVISAMVVSFKFVRDGFGKGREPP